jgi:hypothetical protein
MHAFFQLAQGGSGSGSGVNWLRLLGLLIVFGFSLLSWVLRKLQEQAAKKKAQQAIENRELELLRTGRPGVPTPGAPAQVRVQTGPPPAPPGTPTQSDVDRRIEELRRRREAMARQRAAPATGPAATMSAPSPAPTAQTATPRPQTDRPRPFVFVPGSSGPIVPQRVPRPAPPTAPVPSQSQSPPRQKREPRQEPRRAPAAPASQGTLAAKLERRDAAHQAKNAAHDARAAIGAPPAPVARDDSRVGLPSAAAEWRRALISREVLSPPIALRETEDIAPGYL